MKYSNPLFAVTLAIASFGAALSVNADTVKARCDVFAKGEDRAKSSGLCTFSQRQGNVGIELQKGKRYDLTPVGSKPGNYKDQNGKAAYRQSGLGDRGQIYRLANESIYVYWDTAPFGKNSTVKKPDTTAASSAPEVGSPVSGLSDLVDAKAGQAENTIKQRGYKFLRSEVSGDAPYSYWREPKTNNCVIIRTSNGRYESIVYGSASCN